MALILIYYFLFVSFAILFSLILYRFLDIVIDLFTQLVDEMSL